MKNPFSLAFYGISRQCREDAARPYVTSNILHPYVHATLRTMMSIYCFATIIVGYSYLAHHKSPNTLKDFHIPEYTLVEDASFIGKSFSFFTFLTYWSLALYFAVSAFHTFDYARSLERGGDPCELFLQGYFSKHWGFELAYSLWHTTVTTYPFLVTNVFWGTMYKGPWPTDRFTQWINISIHGLNSLFAIWEILFSATRPPPFLGHLSVVLVGLSMYLSLAYLAKPTQDFYPYAWMDPELGWKGIVAHVFGYAGGMVVIYSIVWGVKWMINRIFERSSPKHGIVILEEEESTNWSMPTSKGLTPPQSVWEKEIKEPMVTEMYYV